MADRFASDLIALTAVVSRGATIRASLLSGDAQPPTAERMVYSDAFLLLLARCMTVEAVRLADRAASATTASNDIESPARFVIPTRLRPRAGVCVVLRVHNGLLQMRVTVLGSENVPGHTVQLANMAFVSRIPHADAAAHIEHAAFRAVGTLS
eukprot:6208294-Pleurochrysis_carterae.AAC.1